MTKAEQQTLIDDLQAKVETYAANEDKFRERVMRAEDAASRLKQAVDALTRIIGAN